MSECLSDVLITGESNFDERNGSKKCSTDQRFFKNPYFSLIVSKVYSSNLAYITLTKSIGHPEVGLPYSTGNGNSSLPLKLPPGISIVKSENNPGPSSSKSSNRSVIIHPSLTNKMVKLQTIRPDTQQASKLKIFIYHVFVKCSTGLSDLPSSIAM